MKFEGNERRIDNAESPEAFFKRDSRAPIVTSNLVYAQCKIPQRDGSRPEGGVSCKLRTHTEN